MCDRVLRLVAWAALALASEARAQSLADWRAREVAASARTARARYVMDSLREGRDLSVTTLVAGGRTVRYRGALTAHDSASIVAGLEAARANLVQRYGERAAPLFDGPAWFAERLERRGGWRSVQFRTANDAFTSFWVFSPVDAREIETRSLAAAGHTLRQRTPAIHGMSGYSAFTVDEARFAEIARRLATSLARSGRDCAAGSLDACALVLSPFDPVTAIDRHFGEREHRAVVILGRLPALSDSAFFADRHRCIDDRDDAACTRIVRRVAPLDPFNDEVRGSLLTHAMALGGDQALGRLAERADTPTLEALAYVAGLSTDDLLRTWLARTHAALDQERDRIEPQLILASGFWVGLLLLASTRRRYL